jgi:hypothetical protein
MSLSNLSRKIFVHIPKNAGMTIRHGLGDRIHVNTPDKHINEKYVGGLKQKMRETNDHLGAEHARWRDLNVNYRQQFDAFAVVRNPWDRVVSRYFFAKKVIEVERKVDPSYADVSSFEAFLEERFKWGNEDYMWHRAVRGWYPALDHVVDDNGKVRCDILRTENLNEDLEKYFGFPRMSRARNVTALNKGSYQDLYNKQTIDIVADWYKPDIDYWGFDFDTGAQKNYWSKS